MMLLLLLRMKESNSFASSSMSSEIDVAKDRQNCTDKNLNPKDTTVGKIGVCEYIKIGSYGQGC